MKRRGFTLLEACLSVTLLGGLLYVFFQSFAGFQRLEAQSAALHSAAADAAKAMESLRRDLERSGFVEVAGVAFPQYFDAGEAPAGFDAFDAPAPNLLSATASQPGQSPELEVATGAGLPGFNADQEPQSRGVLFVQPADADGDRWPDLDGGAPQFAEERVALLLVPEGGKTNNLVRRTEAGRETILCRGVRAFRVDPPAETGFTIPLDSVRVWIQVVRPTERGGLQLLNRVDVIRLRNGGLAP